MNTLSALPAGETCRPCVCRLVWVHSWGRSITMCSGGGRYGSRLRRWTFSVSPARISQVGPGTTLSQVYVFTSRGARMSTTAGTAVSRTSSTPRELRSTAGCGSARGRRAARWVTDPAWADTRPADSPWSTPAARVAPAAPSPCLIMRRRDIGSGNVRPPQREC